MIFEGFLAKLAGRTLAKKIGLQEGTVMETKKWYQSKALWSAVLMTIVGAVQPISSAMGHPVAVPHWITDVLTGLGIYGLRTAEKPIS